MKYTLHCSLLAALALTACTQPGPPSPSVKPAPAHDPVAAVHAIRAAGDGLDSAVQVQPLRDSAIDGFLKKAHDAEAARDYAGAVNAANSALKLAPDAPDILQYLAELEIGRSDWQQAEQLAMKSFSLGPKVGSLCARNWQTMVEARTAMDDAATVAQAKQHLKECRVPPRLRM
ncbi:tetratricopeptide repeat protein [Dokdonella soli]|uniref:Tetratricopeptide repeat protein n=1 Tax=Dokdonella soli TaxID=529810 RepID=A0ABN1ICX7_9GAMM